MDIKTAFKAAKNTIATSSSFLAIFFSFSFRTCANFEHLVTYHFSRLKSRETEKKKEYRKFFFQNSFRIVDTMTMITIKRSRVIRRETIELVDRESTFSAEFRSGADSLALLGP